MNVIRTDAPPDRAAKLVDDFAPPLILPGEHHLCPGVPWYNLPRLHAALRQQLIDRGAPFIGSYFAFVRDFIAGSLARTFSRPARGPRSPAKESLAISKTP